MVTGCVLFEVQPIFLNIILTSFDFKGLIYMSFNTSGLPVHSIRPENLSLY
jgi:hypothetical protein